MDPSGAPPHNRSWDCRKYDGLQKAKVFGLITKKQGHGNVCHLFAELDQDQPAPAVVNFVVKVLLGKWRHNLKMWRVTSWLVKSVGGWWRRGFCALGHCVIYFDENKIFKKNDEKKKIFKLAPRILVKIEEKQLKK